MWDDDLWLFCKWEQVQSKCGLQSQKKMEKKDRETDGGGDGVGGRKRRRVQAARVAVETGY